MSFAIQLFFDPASDVTIRHVWEKLDTIGAPFPLRDPGNRPHISLAIYGELDIPICTGLLDSFAQTQAPFALSITNLGIFHEEKTVLFLAPIITSGLLELQAKVHQLLQTASGLPSAHYLPGHWTPHCTLATWVPPQLISQAVTIALELPLPLPLLVEEIGIMDYPPVKHLSTFRLLGE